MQVLTIDIGGTNVKCGLTYETKIKISSGLDLTPQNMIKAVKEATEALSYNAITIGFPGPVLHGSIALEPHNLGRGWVGFNFATEFKQPVRIMNDAAMQALGNYRGGRMLFLGFGTGLGSALIVDGILQPMELAHLPYKNGKTFEDYVGLRGLDRLGKSKWRLHVADVVAQFKAALAPDYIVLGGGNAKLIKILPTGVETSDNSGAFRGGERIWMKEFSRVNS